MTYELVPGTPGLIAIYETKEKKEGQMPVVGFFKEPDGAGGFTYTAAVINRKGKAVKVTDLKNWKRLDWDGSMGTPSEKPAVSGRVTVRTAVDNSIFGRIFGPSWDR
jgi:hypothetical protein